MLEKIQWVTESRRKNKTVAELCKEIGIAKSTYWAVIKKTANQPGWPDQKPLIDGGELDDTLDAYIAEGW